MYKYIKSWALNCSGYGRHKSDQGRYKNNMAMEHSENLEDFLRNVPTQLEEASRNLHSDNANALEFIQRRLEDSILVLNVLVLRCADFQNMDECMTLLRRLISDVQQMHGRYDDLTSQSRMQSDYRFFCPRENNIRGRPRYAIPNNIISGLHRIHRSWQHVSNDIGVSYRTLLRRRHENGMDVNSTRGPRRSYSNINNDQLCQQVSHILQILPNAGETFVLGALRQRGIHVQRYRVREAIRLVDPLSRAMRRSVAVLRRVYNVPCPNALW